MQKICVFIQIIIIFAPFFNNNTKMKGNNCGSDPRVEICRAIKLHISTERMNSAMEVGEKKRFDAICHVIKDAVKASSLVTFGGTPHVYSLVDGMYIQFDFHEFKTAIDELMRRCNIPDGNYSKAGKIVSDCWSEMMCHKREVDTSVFVMKNGVFDTMDCQIHDHSDKYMTNMSVNYEYNENDTPVGWLSFLNQVLPDKEMQMLLQEFIATSMLDRSSVKFEHALILLGSGSNGKSVVFEVVQALLGKDNVSNFSIKDLIGSKSEQNIASCNGKRMNYCSEIRTSEITDETADAFKSLVSGEPTMARSLYREPFKATRIPVIMANANKMPKLVDASFSLQRRILIIPFLVTIPEVEQNKELASELLTELPGIFNWVVDGFKRLRANSYKITIPGKVREIVAEYIRDNNPLIRWLDFKRYFSAWNPNTKAESTWMPFSDVFVDFDEWCISNSEKRITRNQFVNSMVELGFERKRLSSGNGFHIYVAPTADEVRSAMLDLELSNQRRMSVEFVQAKIKENEKVQITGLEDTERYLGIQEGILYKYLEAGNLEGTYTILKDGRLLFDVLSVQSALASANYYNDILCGVDVSRVASRTMKSMRMIFNSKMRKLGLPFRKAKNTNSKLLSTTGEIIIVPDDWEYSKTAANEVLSRNNSTKIISKYGQ